MWTQGLQSIPSPFLNPSETVLVVDDDEAADTLNAILRRDIACCASRPAKRRSRF